MLTNSTYTGLAYWRVKDSSERRFDLVDMHGKREATYPSYEMAHKVRQIKEANAMRAYLRAQKAEAKKK